MKSGRTFFVTGGTGFLGSKVVRALIARNEHVFCLCRRTSNLIRIKDIEKFIYFVEMETLAPFEFFSSHRVDCLIHCATDYGRKVVDPILTIEANLILPLKLLHAAATCGVPLFINTDTILDKGINNYSLSKAQFADWLESYSDKITGVNLALEHFYGPGDDPTKFTAYVIQSLIAGRDRLSLTAGEQKRDFIYVDDVVGAILSVVDALHLPRSYYDFEVGSGNAITIRAFVNLVKALTDNTTTILDYGAIPYRLGEVMEPKPADLSGIRKLGWRPTIPIEDGLRETILRERQALEACAI